MKGNTAVVRDRYQLTIPEEIRRFLNWLSPERAVRFVVVGKERVALEPYRPQTLVWKDVWSDLEKLKKLGRKINLGSFVIADREKH